MSARPLLMIPGPIEISDAVANAVAERPRAHTAPDFVAAYGRALDGMAQIWRAPEGAVPFAVPGSGTIAMETAASNLIDPGDAVVVASTGYFGDRMAEMLRRRGATVTMVQAPTVGDVPDVAAVREALAATGAKALFATHVDTSTGVRIDPVPLAAAARDAGALSVFDGVCATAGEAFDMAALGADVYLTASQKAIGLPPGMALWVASARALATRAALKSPPPMSIDWQPWQPVMEAYRAGKPSYFSTPATTLGWALAVGTAEILAGDADPAKAMELRWAAHRSTALGFRAAWSAMGLKLLPVRDEVTAHTLSALWLPDGVDAPRLLPEVRNRGAIIAGGLHPAVRERTFRVGHMGVVTGRPDALRLTVSAVAGGLAACGVSVDEAAALSAFDAAFQSA